MLQSKLCTDERGKIFIWNKSTTFVKLTLKNWLIGV